MAFLQVHVSGLPLVCSDEEVEGTLRRVVAGVPVATPQSVAGVSEVGPDGSREPTADAQVADQAAVAEAGVVAPEAPETPVLDDGGVEESLAVDEDELKVLAAFVSCVVVRNKDTQECKGYCFLTFETAEQAEAAIAVLNAGVEIAGERVSAQLSKPKERHAKPKDPSQEIGDLRLRRARYQCVGKKAQYGHYDPECGQKKVNHDRPERNSAGRENVIAGTRGGKPLVLDEGKRSTAYTQMRDHRGL